MRTLPATDHAGSLCASLAAISVLAGLTGCSPSPERAASDRIAQLGGKTRSDHGHVISVNLRKSRATDNDLAGLTQFPQLGRVVLAPGITDMGLRHLEGMANLTSVDLQDTQITDEGLASLKTIPKLKQIYIHGSKVTPEGDRALKAQLPQLAIERFPVEPQ